MKNCISVFYLSVGLSTNALATVPIYYAPGHPHPAGGTAAGSIHQKNIDKNEGLCTSPFQPNGLLARPSCENFFDDTASVQGQMTTQAIFLGDAWSSPLFALDKIEGIDTFLQGWDGSEYSEVLWEYWIGASVLPDQQEQNHLGRVPVQLGYVGYHITPEHLTSTPPSTGGQPPIGLAEVCRGLATGEYATPRSGTSSYFLIYPSIHPPTESGLCAAHGNFTCTTGTSKGASFDYAVIYNADSYAACDVDDQQTGHSQGLAAIANVTARAIADEVTDPHWEGWMSLSGDEVSDLCQWQFDAPYVWFPNGSQWKLQDLWSDLAYLAGTGYANTYGLPGCVVSR